jgi:hypothetical protein
VQSALNRLGNPTNNELLAELIKLGAQPGSNGKVFDGNAVHFELVFFFFSSLRLLPGTSSLFFYVSPVSKLFYTHVLFIFSSLVFANDH